MHDIGQQTKANCLPALTYYAAIQPQYPTCKKIMTKFKTIKKIISDLEKLVD